MAQSSQPQKAGGPKNKPPGKQNSGGPSGNSLKEREKRRRQVFKPVLDNPYTQVNWPFIKPSTNEDILNLLLSALRPIGVYNEVMKRSESDKKVQTPEMPDILQKVTIGFNSTTAALEGLAKNKPQTLPIEYVFICKYDIPAKILVQHFPVLTYTASKGANRTIKLVQLSKGSAQAISDALKIPDTTILGLSKDSPLSNTSFFNEIPDVEVPYLEHLSTFNKPVINFLSTSAPITGKNDKKKPQKSQSDSKEPPQKKQKKNQQ